MTKSKIFAIFCFIEPNIKIFIKKIRPLKGIANMSLHAFDLNSTRTQIYQALKSSKGLKTYQDAFTELQRLMVQAVVVRMDPKEFFNNSVILNQNIQALVAKHVDKKEQIEKDYVQFKIQVKSRIEEFLKMAEINNPDKATYGLAIKVALEYGIDVSKVENFNPEKPAVVESKEVKQEEVAQPAADAGASVPIAPDINWYPEEAAQTEKNVESKEAEAPKPAKKPEEGTVYATPSELEIINRELEKKGYRKGVEDDDFDTSGEDMDEDEVPIPEGRRTATLPQNITTVETKEDKKLAEAGKQPKSPIELMRDELKEKDDKLKQDSDNADDEWEDKPSSTSTQVTSINKETKPKKDVVATDIPTEKPKMPVTAPVVEKKPQVPISAAQPKVATDTSKKPDAKPVVEVKEGKKEEGVNIPKTPMGAAMTTSGTSKDTATGQIPVKPAEKKPGEQATDAANVVKPSEQQVAKQPPIADASLNQTAGVIKGSQGVPMPPPGSPPDLTPKSVVLPKVEQPKPKGDATKGLSVSTESKPDKPATVIKTSPVEAKPNEAPPVPPFTEKKSEVKPAIPLPPKPYVSKTTPASVSTELGKPSDAPPPLPEYKPLESDKPHESKEKAPPVPPLPSGTVNVADTVMPDASKGPPPLPPYNTVSKPTAKPSGEVPTVPTAGQTKEVPTAKPKVPTVGSSVKDKIQALEAQGKLPIMPTAKPAVPKSQTTTSPATPVKPDVAGLNAATATKPADTQAASTKPPIPARPPKSPQQENALIAIGRMKKVVDFLEINSSKMNVDASRNFNQLKQTQQKLDELYKQKNYAEIIKIMHASDEKGEYATTIAKLHSATKPVQTDIARKMNDLSRAVQNMPDKDNFNKIHKDEIVALLNMKKYIYNKYSSSYFKKNPTALEQFQDDYNKINKEIDRFHAMIKGDQKLAAQGQDQQQSMSKITTGYAGQQQSGSNVYSPTQGPQDGSLDLFNLKQQAGSGIKFGNNIEPEKYKVFAEKSIEYIQGQINSKTSVTYQNVQFEGAKDPMNHTLLIDNNERIKRMHDNKDTATITIKNPPSDKGIAILFDINKELPVLSMKDCHGVTDTKTLLRLLQGALLAGRSLEDGTFQLHEDDKKELEKDPIYQEMKQKNLLQSADFVKHVDGLKSQGKDYKLGESLEGITPAPKPDEIRFTGKPGQTH